MSSVVSHPADPRMRVTDTDRSCSVCAFESRARPVVVAGSKTWNGYTRVMLLVTGTTVTTPVARAAAAFAVLLLTITAGRTFAASDPVAGSNDTSTMAPRRSKTAASSLTR